MWGRVPASGILLEGVQDLPVLTELTDETFLSTQTAAENVGAGKLDHLGQEGSQFPVNHLGDEGEEEERGMKIILIWRHVFIRHLIDLLRSCCVVSYLLLITKVNLLHWFLFSELRSVPRPELFTHNLFLNEHFTNLKLGLRMFVATAITI